MTRGHRSDFRFGLFSKNNSGLLDLVSLEPNQPPVNSYSPEPEEEFIFTPRQQKISAPKATQAPDVIAEVNADMAARKRALKEAAQSGYALCEVCMNSYFSKKVKVDTNQSVAA